MKAYSQFKTRATPQSEKIPGKKQVKNNAGGYVFQISDWARLDRFLVLGSEGSTYYATEKKLTTDNAEGVLRCIVEDGVRVVNRVVEISDSGRAPKNDPALFVLAMCAGAEDVATRRAALSALSQVARIGTHLFHFLAFVEQFRGWGRGLRSAVGDWYNAMPADKLAYQVIKYQQRDGWSHHDLLHLAHPKPVDEAHNSIYRWAKTGELSDNSPKWLTAFAAIQSAPDAKTAAMIVRDYRLPREAVPTQFLNELVVWEALLEDMPMTALIRNLATLTRVGVIAPLSVGATKAVDLLSNFDNLRKARVHPIALLSALKTYEQGHGVRSDKTWEPVPQVVDALNDAFYASFRAVEPTHKNWLLALDVSGSMTLGDIAGVPGLNPRVASAAMSLVTASVEKNYHVMGFATEFVNIPISPRLRLDGLVRKIDSLTMGGTDCALPMVWALKNKIEVDAFAIYTDNETWAGSIHPVQALREYRQKMGIDAKLIVVGMTATEFSIADPEDGNSMDVVGFDAAAPQIMADFAR
jgi:60 kDa SS-A/Ro ribonucleoprotein